jgi:dihydrodipicolinate synthase/N-acetylneuraminate lyase
MNYPHLDSSINVLLQEGTVIPAHPLALNEQRNLDERRQRLLTKYYCASGAGGVAVGVHTTQFEIRKPAINLLESVLRIASEEIELVGATRPFIKVAGIVGPTSQATKEAEIARSHGYHLGLISMGGLGNYSENQLLERTHTVASVIPIFGFYLQPAVGGRLLSYNFWREFVEIPNVYAIKIAAFNRYQTLDVVRAVCDSSRREQIALYTGNDDNIVADLLTPYRFDVDGTVVEKRFVGGLLGHWAAWTKAAVDLLKTVKSRFTHSYSVEELLAEGIRVTDMNAAIFDAANSFKGCIPGIHEVLRRQGLLEGRWCLDPHEELSPGQMEEIDRVIKSYPQHTDDKFVMALLEKMNVSAL